MVSPSGFSVWKVAGVGVTHHDVWKVVLEMTSDAGMQLDKRLRELPSCRESAAVDFGQCRYKHDEYGMMRTGTFPVLHK